MKTPICIVTILVLLCSAASCTQKQKNDEIIETKDGPKIKIETLVERFLNSVV
jgi:hypothetical protein